VSSGRWTSRSSRLTRPSWRTATSLSRPTLGRGGCSRRRSCPPSRHPQGRPTRSTPTTRG
jgi:hypothetical protein